MIRPTIAASFLITMTSLSSPEAIAEWRAPFYYMHPIIDREIDDHQPYFIGLRTSLRHYREMAEGIIRKLSISHEVARRTEEILFPHHDHSRCTETEASLQSQSFLSCRLERKISKSAILLEQNSLVLERLLRPFPVIVGHSKLGPSSVLRENSDVLSSSSPNSHFTFPPSIDKSNLHQTDPDHSRQLTLARYIPPHIPGQSTNYHDFDEEPYDSASHIITHLVRDWTSSGQAIRKDTHDWILDQLYRLHENCNNIVDTSSDADPSNCAKKYTSSLSPVLVPGAGMARLAFDIAFALDRGETNLQYHPFAVEAADNSIVMASAAYHILHYNFSGSERQNLEVFPFVTDPFSNEVNSQRRWDSALFSEDSVSRRLCRLKRQQSSNRPSLSYTIGDFVSVYASSAKHAKFGSVATCFFIDTATNIYEYILTIRNLLRVGGVWINLGPVQWHRNTQLQPSADELREIILLSGFKIKTWAVSSKLVAYRHPDDILIGTRAEAYMPLKFVVVLQPDDSAQDEAVKTGEDLTRSLEKLRRSTGRKSMVHSNN